MFPAMEVSCSKLVDYVNKLLESGQDVIASKDVVSFARAINKFSSISLLSDRV